MKRFNPSSLAVTVMVLGIGATGCNSNSSAQQAAAPQQQSSPAWSLEYKTTCAAGSDATDCVGAYGFKINADGTFVVGPGPQGELANGKLDAEDFSQLTQDVSGVIDGTSATALSGESCNGYFGDVADYTLTFIKKGQKHELMHKKGGDLCSAELSADSAETLHNEMIDLANRYYPSPFPDQCQEAASQVEALYAPLTKCSVDADCAYLNQNYQPISTDTNETVYLDDCSRVTPLPAANRAAVSANLDKLEAALANAQHLCGIRIARDDCSQPRSFASSAAPAVCERGACSVNPQLVQ